MFAANGLGTDPGLAPRFSVGNQYKNFIGRHDGGPIVKNLICGKPSGYRSAEQDIELWNAVCGICGRLNASTCEVRRAAGMKEQAETEYTHLMAFAREQAALLKRLRRTGLRPAVVLEWHSSDAYLRDLRAAVEAAERQKSDREAQAWRSARGALLKLFPLPRLSGGPRPTR